MKYLKILGLAAIAAMAMMAMGAGSASANTTTLCTTTTTPCPSGWQIDQNNDSHIQGQITHGALWPTSGDTNEPMATCTTGRLAATMESDTTAQITTLIAEECGTLTVETVTLGKLHISNIPGTHDGTGTLTNSVVRLRISHSITCFYGVEGEETLDLGRLETTTLNVNSVVNRIDNPTHDSSILCPATANWETSGYLETPSPVYVLTDA